MENPGLEIKGGYKNIDAGADIWWYGGGNTAWPSIQEALDNIPRAKRMHLTIGVFTNGIVSEYWWNDANNLEDNGLVRKLADATDTTKFFTKEEANARFYTKDEVDNRSYTKDEINFTYPTKEVVDQTTSLINSRITLVDNKFADKADKTEVATEVTRLDDKIDRVLDGAAISWNESIVFTYDGRTNVFATQFTPIGMEPSFLDTTYLDPKIDYYYVGKTVVINKTLHKDVEYKLSLNYKTK